MKTWFKKKEVETSGYSSSENLLYSKTKIRRPPVRLNILIPGWSHNHTETHEMEKRGRNNKVVLFSMRPLIEV